MDRLLILKVTQESKATMGMENKPGVVAKSKYGEMHSTSVYVLFTQYKIF